MPRVTRAPRNSINDRPTRWQILLRRQRRLLRPALIALAGLAVVLTGIALARGPRASGLATAMRAGLAHMLPMQVHSIVVEGRTNTPEHALQAALGVQRGDPIFGFSVTEARVRLEGLSWVQHAVVERRLPGTVLVTLEERRPFAIWQNKGRFVVIDRDGQVVAEKSLAAFGNLPLVVGEGAPPHAAALLDALAAEPALMKLVAAATRVGERRWNLRMKNGTDVLLPGGAVKPALARLAQLQAQRALLDRPLAVVDMRLPDRMVIRPVAEQHPDQKDPHAAAAPKRQT